MPGWRGDRGTRQERGYGAQWQRDRVTALRRDSYTCQPCRRSGRITEATEVDHIVPKSQDGEDDIENLQGICKACHAAKTTREAAAAQGRKPRPQFDARGWPIWD